MRLKVSKGEPLRASKWNRLVDYATRTNNGYQSSFLFGGQATLMVLNVSGRDADTGELLYMNEWNGPTGTNPNELLGETEIKAIEPSWHDKIDNIVVAAEPIPNNERGMVVLAGMCVVKVSNTDAGEFIMPNPLTTYESVPTTAGIGKVLARVDDNYVMASLRLGSDFFRYEMTEASQAPDVTAAKLIDLDGNEIASSIELSDPLSLMDDQGTGDEGYCRLIGNRFVATEAPC